MDSVNKSMKFCVECGSRIELENAKFCPNCCKSLLLFPFTKMKFIFTTMVCSVLVAVWLYECHQLVKEIRIG